MSASFPQMGKMSGRRLVFLLFAFVVFLHYLLNFVYKDYARLSLPSFNGLASQLGISGNRTNGTEPLVGPLSSLPDNATLVNDPSLELEGPAGTTEENQYQRANATFVFLCRNSDIAGVVSSIQQMEDRFNKNYGYPWVLLNEEPFTEEFKQRVRVLTDAPVHFGQIPPEHWYQPDWIDEEHARQSREHMMSQGIIYAGSVPYRNMCRFNSGFFFKHELLRPYRYYWRVEPEVKFFCDVNYDPFKFMERNNKVYGFTISLVEWEPTIPTLWNTVKEFITENPEYISSSNSMDFLSNDNGQHYNLCHFWSNFEIADMDFWRGEAYQKFFEFLDFKGGFYYEASIANL
ncbi:hypothetical protein D9613_003068 [Agrocybe pediades]|uniref:Uncharacterized protein n=1 Tax=Agrocybe pediades TaxID=84607 RepID=A0A8H4VNY2_9AGAR|nr:hypothetical protein D9613_003068 [Agrocybe pediades]